MTHILYGGELSYFSGKARSYPRCKGIEFEERLSTRDNYASVIIPRIADPMIPLLITPQDEAIQDTSEIIDYGEKLQPSPGVIPAGARPRVAAHLLDLYGDEWLVIPAMHFRWAHNRDFANAEFVKLTAPDADAQANGARGPVLVADNEK